MSRQLVKAGKYAIKKYPAVQKRYRVYAPAVKQLASDVMYLKSLVNSEPHYHVVTTSNNFDYNGTVVSLSSVPQGDTSVSRDGDRILPRYLNLKFHINKQLTAPTNPHITVRYIVFRAWSESPNAVGVSPVPSDILQLATIGTQYAPLSALSQAITGPRGDRSRRIEVHRSGFFTLDGVGKTSVDEDINIELNGKSSKSKEHMDYYDNTTAPPTSGGFFILFISDNITATDQAFYLNSKLTFYDN